MSFWRRKIVTPLGNLLRQGITPEKLALSIALGMMLGITPVIGSTSLLCLLAALLLRLNVPALQLVNYLAYPLQLALFIPFLRMGQWVFSDTQVLASLPQIFHMIRSDVWLAITTLWTATMHALLVWLALSALAGPILYWVLLPLLRKLQRQLRPEVA